MRAWLITWCWIGDHAAVDDPVVAFLSARTAPEGVRRYVERRYIDEKASLREKLSYARWNRQKPAYPAEFYRLEGVTYMGQIRCGHNPWLYARLVDDLRAEMDADGNDVPKWTETEGERLDEVSVVTHSGLESRISLTDFCCRLQQRGRA